MNTHIAPSQKLRHTAGLSVGRKADGAGFLASTSSTHAAMGSCRPPGETPHHVRALVVVDEVAVGHEREVLAVALAAGLRRHHPVRDEVRQEGRACPGPPPHAVSHITSTHTQDMGLDTAPALFKLGTWETVLACPQCLNNTNRMPSRKGTLTRAASPCSTSLSACRPQAPLAAGAARTRGGREAHVAGLHRRRFERKDLVARSLPSHNTVVPWKTAPAAQALRNVHSKCSTRGM